jgi:hypothetical protein
VSSVHFDQFNAQNLRDVNGKCVENARKDLKNAHISAKSLDGKSVHKKGFCLCHSFFNNILHFCTFSENDAQAFLDLYTNWQPFMNTWLKGKKQCWKRYTTARGRSLNHQICGQRTKII